MRVLLFHYCELGELGGVEVAVLSLANEWAARGCPTGVIQMGPRWKPRQLLGNGIPTWSVASPSNLTVRRPRSWASFARATWQFARVVREFRPDIVNVQFPIAQMLPVIGGHLLPHRWHLVVTVHNSDIRVSPFEDPGLRPWQARLFARADAVTAVSRSMLEDTAQLYPHVLAKARVIHNGVGSMWFQDVAEEASRVERYVLFAGRLARVKGVDLLLRAWKQIRSSCPGTRLWIVGEGTESEGLRALARDLGIFDVVRFLGRKSQDELVRLYRGADAVALPSRREGMPFVVLEALAAGGITITTRIPGVSELIDHGVTGYLVEPESPEALAAAILSALQLPAEASRRMRGAAQSVMRAQFSVEKMVSAYLDLFESLCSGRSGEIHTKA